MFVELGHYRFFVFVVSTEVSAISVILEGVDVACSHVPIILTTHSSVNICFIWHLASLFTDEQKFRIEAKLIRDEGHLEVTWPTNINDIVTIIVIIENIEEDFTKTTIVDWNAINVSLPIDPMILRYNVSVTIIDRCRQSHRSYMYSVGSDTQSSASKKS